MINASVYHSLGLSDVEYDSIVKILDREPTTTELAMFSVQWSEHCGYVSSRKWLKLLPKKGKAPSLIGEDSGGIIIGDKAIIFKAESHNHPSQIEPKQGAATGVGGILRDIFTAGARPIALLNSLRFGLLKDAYNRYLLKGVVDGIQSYGNCVGVPTVGGEIYFDESYNGNCLVNVMSIGITDKEKLVRAQSKGVGNVILYVGASTGRDGIGGCSVLASNEFCEGEERRPAVQIGDPFMEKCLIEATLEALELGHIVGIKDMGAAGLTCSVSEMAYAGESGMEIELENVPRREAGMELWELMMSESQERMLVCVEKGFEDEIKAIFSKWGLNAAVIGRVIAGDAVLIKDKGKIVANMKASALTESPLYDAEYKEPRYLKKARVLHLSKIPESINYDEVLIKLLSSPSIASKRWVYEQYDTMVQTNSLVLPGSDAAVIRLKGSDYALAATMDCNSRYCYLDPYQGAQIAVAEAARNLVCSGAEPQAVTDCLNFGSPKKPDMFWQFKQAVKGIADSCEFFDLAVVSGNVSLYNESPQGTIFPTPVIGMIGLIDDLSNISTQYFKRDNELIILLGECKEELGGSEYLKEIYSLTRGEIPRLDLDLEKSLHVTVLEVIKKGLISSAHDCSEGGLAVALAECCISNNEKTIGAEIDNLNFNIRADALLFGESQSRVIISSPQESLSKIKEIAGRNKVPFRVIGKTGGDYLRISYYDRKFIDAPLFELDREWSGSLERSIKGA